MHYIYDRMRWPLRQPYSIDLGSYTVWQRLDRRIEARRYDAMYGGYVTVIADIDRLAWLKELYLSGYPVTTDDISRMSYCRQLEVLDLSSCGINGTDIGDLKALTELRTLSLARNNVNGQCLEFISTLVRLETLNLDYTQVDESGVEQLVRAGRLRKLSVVDTPLTYDTGTGLKSLALLALESRLPNCEIRLND